MATDLTHLGVDDYDSIEEIANAVSDDLTDVLTEYPGTMSSPGSIGAAARGVVLAAFGRDEEDQA